MTEQDLIIRMKNGDKQAFGVLSELHARRLMAYCLGYIHIVEDAEEILQEVFLSVWRNREDIKNTRSLRPLLNAAIRNKILYYFRSKINSPLYEDFVNIKEEHVGYADEATLEYEEFRNMVMTEIENLPRTQRDSITLSKLHGMSNAEIAETLGLNIQTVKNALSQGLKTLRDRLGRNSDLILPLLIAAGHYITN